MHKCIHLLVGFFCLIALQANAVELIPDYYEQAGPNPYSSSVDQAANESIDPFSGQLSLSYTDIYLPGNGGMDISVSRTYSSSSSENSYWSIRSFLGFGWQMHMGRMIRRTDVNTCINHNLPTLDSPINNPLFEMPSGARKQFFAPDFSENYLWISMDRWKMDCADTPSGLVYTITAPNGYKYYLDHVEQDLDEKIALHYVTAIEDLNGNRIEISYISGTLVQGLALIDEIKGYDSGTSIPDGRLVKFNYDDTAGSAPKLSSIEADGRTWIYDHISVPGYAVDKHLSRVIRPDGTSFDYEYYDRTENFGANSLRKVTSLYGLETEYTYGSMDFDLDNEGLYINTVVTSKTVSGGNVQTGVWDYSYSASREYDETTVTSPKGKYVYRNVGLMSARLPDSPDQALFYAIGLPMEELVYDSGDNLVSHTQYRWGYQKLSDENYFRPSRAVNDFSHETNAPLLLAKSIQRDGNAYLTRFVPIDQEANYLNYFDKFGNPKQKEEIGSVSRKTSYTYHHEVYGEDAWLVNTVKDETIHDAGVNDASNELIDHTVTRTFDTQGRVTGQVVNGVSSQTTYHSSGNIHTTTDALGFVSTYTDYYRGVPRSEEQQVSSTKSVFRSKILNYTGTTRSSTDEENRTTHYTYDQMNRLASMTYPTGSPVNIVYSKLNGKITNKTLTRGGLQVHESMNGHGQVVCKTYRDLYSGQSIQQSTRYNAVSEPVFVSFESQGACSNALSKGVSYDYDAIGRKVSETFADGAKREMLYTAPYTFETTDERGFKTTTQVQAFADPSGGLPVYIAGAEGTETRIGRDLLGNKLAVWQGNQSEVGVGVVKTYGYNSRFQLVKEFISESNAYKYFERDALGQTLSWHIEKLGLTSNGATFTYDGLGRLTSTDIESNGSLDESYTYYDDSQVHTSTRLNASRTYTYDSNGNIDTVSVQTKPGTTFEIDYSFNDLDYLESITYPSGRIVSYEPDALGRATRVGDYVTQVLYNGLGLIDSFSYSNGATTYRSYDENRLFLTNISASANDNVVDKVYQYDFSGNLTALEDLLDSQNNLSASYDGLGRLSTASGRWGSASYDYDYNGNILSSTVGGSVKSYEYDNSRRLSAHSVNGSKTYFNYDVFGSVYRMNGARSYNFTRTPEGLVTRLEHNGIALNHAFDTEKRRVTKNDGKLELHYVWAEDTRLLGSYHADDMYEEHIYLGSQRVATAELNMRPKLTLAKSTTAHEYSTTAIVASASNVSSAITPIYSWSQIAGPTATLSNTDQLQLTVEVPPSALGKAITLELSMTTPLGTQRKQIEVQITFTDVDGDQLSDQFEQNYFGDLSQVATNDPDGDGLSNLEEFERGSDPTIAQSPDAVTGLKLSAGRDRVQLAWDTSPRATHYNIYWSTSPLENLANANKIEAVQSGYLHTGLSKNEIYYRVTALNAAESLPSVQATAIPGLGAWTDFSEALVGFDVDKVLAIDTSNDGRVGVAFTVDYRSTSSSKPNKSINLASRISNGPDYYSLTQLLLGLDSGGGGFSLEQCTLAGVPINIASPYISQYGMLVIDPDLVQCSQETISRNGYTMGSSGLIGYSAPVTSSTIKAFFVEFLPGSGWTTPTVLGEAGHTGKVQLSYGSGGNVLMGARFGERLDILYRNAGGALEKQFTVDNAVNSDTSFGLSTDNLYDLVLNESGEGLVIWAGSDSSNGHGNGIYLKEISSSGNWSDLVSLRPSDANLRTVINLSAYRPGDEALVSFSGCNNWGGDCAQHLAYKRDHLGWITPIERTANYSASESQMSNDYIDYCDVSSAGGETSLACDFQIQQGYDWGYNPSVSNFVRSFDSLFSGYAKTVDIDHRLLADGTEQFDEDIWALSGYHYYSESGNSPSLGERMRVHRSDEMFVMQSRQDLSIWAKGSRWTISNDGYGNPENAAVTLSDDDSVALATALDGKLKVKRLVSTDPSLAVTMDVPSLVHITEGSTKTVTAETTSSLPLNFFWEQVSGPSASYVDLADGRVDITAPLVTGIEFLTFKVTATNAANASDAQTVYVSVEVSPVNPLPTARLTCRDNCYFLSHEHSESHTHQALTVLNTDEPSPYNGWRRYPEASTVWAPNEIKVVEESGLELIFASNEPLLYPHYEWHETDRDQLTKSVRVYASKSKRAYPGETVELVPQITSSGGFDVDTRWDQVRGEKTSSFTVSENGLRVEIPPQVGAQTLRYRFKGKEAQTAANTPSDNIFSGWSDNSIRPHHYDFVDIEIVDPASGPIAFTGENKEALEGATVSMNALGSRSGEGQSLTYLWEQIEGPEVTLCSSTEAQVTFAAPDVQHFEVLRFRLTVTDERGRTDQDVETVTVVYDNQPPVLNMTSVLEVYEGEDFDVMLYSPQDETKVYFENGEYYSGLSQVSGPQAIRVGCLFNNCRNGQTYEAPEVDSAQQMVFERRGYDTQGLETVEQIVVYVLDESDSSMFDVDSDGDGIPNAYDPNPNVEDQYQAHTEYQGTQIATGDPENPYTWEFVITGSAGNDYVNATTDDPNATMLQVFTLGGDDLIDLRQGVVAYGGRGNDTFVISEDYAEPATVIGGRAQDHDVLKFASGLDVQNIAFQVASNKDLLITFELDGEPRSVTVKKFFNAKTATASGKGIDALILTDGLEITAEEISMLLDPYTRYGEDGRLIFEGTQEVDVVTGTEFGDRISTYEGDDILEGGPGRDRLRGGAGNDTYIFNPGDGKDKIQNWDLQPEASTDILRLTHTDKGIEDIWFYNDGEHIRVYILGTRESILLTKWYRDATWQIDQIELPGHTLDQFGIEALAAEMSELGEPEKGEISLTAEQRAQINTQIQALWQAR